MFMFIAMIYIQKKQTLWVLTKNLKINEVVDAMMK